MRHCRLPSPRSESSTLSTPPTPSLFFSNKRKGSLFASVIGHSSSAQTFVSTSLLCLTISSLLRVCPCLGRLPPPDAHALQAFNLALSPLPATTKEEHSHMKAKKVIQRGSSLNALHYSKGMEGLCFISCCTSKP
ncbi:hypothetical protein DEO72_LG3g2433 [Vigna unguiculata]|uniref:Uncharacterized protein n=1 Tax=Vigna unguiculata TaxID=3917 RepID=A0A4D6LH91_VIGUN|nr:hypothetical protein DEO72_LG3g2433 [Vigna unguiculata]